MQEKPGKVRISVRHVKAARGLLDWTVQQLAERANISAATIHNWGKSPASASEGHPRSDSKDLRGCRD
jgi:DNA-binding transcriptional regulator YiaG